MGISPVAPWISRVGSSMGTRASHGLESLHMVSETGGGGGWRGGGIAWATGPSLAFSQRPTRLVTDGRIIHAAGVGIVIVI